MNDETMIDLLDKYIVEHQKEIKKFPWLKEMFEALIERAHIDEEDFFEEEAWADELRTFH